MYPAITQKLVRHTWLVCCTYAVMAGLWIWFSDHLLATLVEPDHLTRLQSWKGLLFVVVTSVLLFALLSRKNRSIRDLFDKLSRQAQHFQATFEQAAVGVIHVSADEKWIRVNKKACDILEYSPHEFRRLSLDQIVHHEDLEKGRAMDQKIASGEIDSYVTEKRYVTKSGRITFTRLTKSAVRNTEGELLYLIAIIEEINAQKEAEKKLIQSLKEKEKLLAEIHHRVKNNLAVISGLMELQIFNSQNELVRGILKETMVRIKTMALIHESYYEKGELAYVTIDDYMRGFVRYIQNTYENLDGKVSIKLDVDAVRLNINQAIPCGLLLAELLIHCLAEIKQANREVVVTVELKEAETDFVLLRIAGHLTGLRKLCHAADDDTLASTIIRALIRQLGASMNASAVEATRYSGIEIAFRKEAEKKGSSNAYIAS